MKDYDMKNNDFDAQEDLEEIEYPQDGLRWMSVVVLLLVVSGFLALAWYAYHSEVSSPKSDAEVPLIEADNKSFKERPKDPGGMEIQHQDKLVYGAVSKDSEAQNSTVEHLLPDAEEASLEPLEAAKQVDIKDGKEKEVAAKIEEDQKTKTWVKEQDKSKALVVENPEAVQPATPEKTEPTEVKAVNVQEKASATPANIVPDVAAKPAEKAPAPKQAATEWKAADAEVKKTEAEKAKPEAKPAAKAVKYGKAGVEDLIVAQADKYNSEKSAKPAPKALVKPVKSPASGGAYMAQVASLRSHADANATWKTLQAKYAALRGMNYKIDPTNIAGKGTYYRLRVTGFSNAAAVSGFCRELQVKGQACMPVK